jgi:hypothetical protein
MPEKFPQPEISAEQMENIEKIERLELGAIPRAEAILVLLGLKPATDFETYTWNDDWEKVASVLKNTGVEMDIQIPKGEKNVTALFKIAKTKEDLEKLLSLRPGDHEKYGRLMGYPESAIKGYLNKQTMDDEKIPELNDLGLCFKLSKANWQEEIKTIKTWNQIIKKFAPDVYRDLRPE